MSLEAPEVHSDLLDDFYAECDEHLSAIRAATVLLEPSIGKAQADLSITEELFRSFHSLKGISAIVGLQPAEALAHVTEDILRELTRGKVSLSQKGLDLLMASAQMLEQIVIAFRARSPIPSHEALVNEISSLVGVSRDSSGGIPPAPRAANTSAADPVLLGRIDEARSQGNLIWRYTFIPTPALDARGVNINAVRTRLSSSGEILQATPKVLGKDSMAFEFIVAMKEAPPNVASWESDGISMELLDQTFEMENLKGAASTMTDAGQTQTQFIALSHIVRVDLKHLDELMRITGELVIHKSRLEQHLAKAGAKRATVVDLASIQEVDSSLGKSFRELREAIMRIRLVPVAEIFARMPFVVRDLARQTNKKVRLVLEGQQTEIDKYLIERLKDPLLHLVRNAFTHGIETTEERRANGKPPEATITLRASTAGDAVILQVRDDGRGIDPKTISKRASALGLTVSPKLDHVELLQILCSAGFTTKEDVDRIAGRGVGMAVVQNTIRELGGIITLDTEVGRGTQFTLRLPLTLAVAETFIVSFADQICAIPQSFVREVLQIQEAEVRTVNRVEVIPYRNGILPVFKLSSMFRMENQRKPSLAVLVLSSERGSAGLIVDKIHGQKEVVVQALRDPLIQVAGITGATQLGDGKPVLILDASFFLSGAVRPHTVI